MIISEQHRQGPKKPEDKREAPEDKGKPSKGHARSANPQQSVEIGDEDPRSKQGKASSR